MRSVDSDCLVSERIKPRILMVTHVVPYPPTAGNEIRIYRMLLWFKKLGYFTTLVLRPLGELGVSDECRRGLLGVVDQLRVLDEKRTKPQIDSSFCKTVKPLDPDVCDQTISDIQDIFCPSDLVSFVADLILEVRPHVIISEYIFMSRVLALSEAANILRIIDTHDLFCRKHEIAAQYGIKDYRLGLTESQERSLLRRADVILAIQKAEQIEMEKIVPDRKIVLTSIDIEIQEFLSNSVAQGQVLILASSNVFNVRGTQDFIDFIWPLIRERKSDAHLRVVGRVCEHIHTFDPSINLVGFVEDTSADYQQAEVVVNPCRVGTGLKIKTVEALSWGKAHVAWPSAIDGLRELGDVPVVVARNAVEFADSVVEISENSMQRRALEAAAREFARINFGSERVYLALTDEIQAFLMHHEGLV